MITDVDKIRIKDRVPEELLNEILYHRDFTEDIKDHENFIKHLQENPIHVYKQLKKRLTMFGVNAEFPEFKGCVGYCIQELFQNKENTKIIENDVALKKLIEVFKHSLMSIIIKNRYFFPYAITIRIIEEALQYLDVIIRIKNPKLPNYYHNVRYHTYLNFLIEAAPDTILIPTFAILDINYFIKTRCVPIYPVGIVNKPLLTDMYLNTPLEFFIHDIGHGRRLHQETDRYYDLFIKSKGYERKRSPFDLVSKEDFYMMQYNYSKVILKLIKRTRDKQKANLKRLIIFEIIHEASVPLIKSEVCKRIQMSYDKFPIEKFIETENHFMKMKFSSSADPTPLSHLYHKLRHGFFDNVKHPDSGLLDPSYRTAGMIAKTALEFMKELNCNNLPTYEHLLDLTQNTTYAGEFLHKEEIKQKNTTMKNKGLKSKTFKKHRDV